MTFNIINFKRTLAWFLVMHVTIFSYANRSNFVTTELKIRNGMEDVKHPEIVYHCEALQSGLDYGWRRAIKPPLGHAFIVLLEGSLKLEEEIHRCHFHSVFGTADVDIPMTIIDAEICNFQHACASHVVTREGILYDGKEWDFEDRYPRLISRTYIEARWKPWPRHSSRGQADTKEPTSIQWFMIV